MSDFDNQSTSPAAPTLRRLSELPVGLPVEVEIYGERHSGLVCPAPAWGPARNMIPVNVNGEISLFSADVVFAPIEFVTQAGER